MSDKSVTELSTSVLPWKGISKSARKIAGSRRKSSSVSGSDQSPTPTRMAARAEVPLTPESPPFRITRKRAAEALEERDMEVETRTPSHTRMSSGESRNSGPSAVSREGAHLCICQPDPKIPRPRNGECLSENRTTLAQHSFDRASLSPSFVEALCPSNLG